jgi:predicted glutamine amidotransferase
MTLNADGFGVGWYGRCSAAVFKSTTAAWNNRNLRELARTIESTCAPPPPQRQQQLRRALRS